MTEKFRGADSGRLRGRGAWRRRGQERACLCRPGRSSVRSRGRRSRLRPVAALSHQRGQALQVQARRARQTPNSSDPDPGRDLACRPWLVAELNRIKPTLIVVLGAVAAQSLLGPDFRVTRSRGEPLSWPDVAADPDDFPAMKGTLVATVHPASVLRADDRQAAYDEFLRDLKVAFNTL